MMIFDAHFRLLRRGGKKNVNDIELVQHAVIL